MMRYLFLLGLLVAAGCSSSKTDGAAKTAGDPVKAAGASAASTAAKSSASAASTAAKSSASAASAASAASTVAKSVVSAAKKAVESKAPAAPADPAGQLVGIWKADVDAIVAMMQNDPKTAKMPEQMKKTMIEGISKQLGKMSFEFTQDGKMIATLSGKDKRSEGTYKVKTVNGNELTIEGTMDGKTEELKAIVDGDTLVLDTQGLKIAFKR